MNIMKSKVIIIFLLIAIVFCFSGCDNKKGNIDVESLDYKETMVYVSMNELADYENYQFEFSEDGELYFFGWEGEVGLFVKPLYKVYLEDYEQKIEKLEFKNDIFSTYDINCGPFIFDAENRLFVLDYPNNKVIVFDSGGNIINSINGLFEKVHKYFTDQESYMAIRKCYIENDDIYILMEETSEGVEKMSIYSAQKFNWRTGEHISSFVLEGLTSFPYYYDGLLYGFDKDGIVAIDMSGNIVKKVSYPENNVMDTDCEADNYGYGWLKQNKALLYSENGNIYYANANGIYCAKENEDKFSLIMLAENSELIKGDYHLMNLGVNNGKIYIMAKDNSESQWPQYIYIYEEQ